MGRFAVQNGTVTFKPLDKESPAHRTLCYINRMRWRMRWPRRWRRSSGGALRARDFLFRSVLLQFLLFLPSVEARAQAPPASSPRVVIVDTDAGSDDLMAIAFLLSRPDIHVEAITIVSGMAHVQAGGQNVLRF